MLSYDSTHIRLLWGVVETHKRLLRGLSDEAIQFWILKNIRDRLHLTEEESHCVQSYLIERANLIRDILEGE